MEHIKEGYLLRVKTKKSGFEYLGVVVIPDGETGKAGFNGEELTGPIGFTYSTVYKADPESNKNVLVKQLSIGDEIVIDGIRYRLKEEDPEQYPILEYLGSAN